jgi:hypothetical protein
MSDLYINIPAAAAAATQLSTATLMKTGQTTSYRTGDDGNIQEGRLTSFTILASNNPFGDTNRFTSELGTQTYTNNIVIDWSTYNGSTVLGIYRSNFLTSAVTWNNAIDNSLSLSVGSYTTGWRLWNYYESVNFMLFESNYQYNYSPLNGGTTNNSYWTSNTYKQNTGFAWCSSNIGQHPINDKTTLAGLRIAVRNFTVTGTTLT